MREQRLISASGGWERGTDIRVLRARLMGLWAARQLGFDDDAADRYASEVVATERRLGRHGIMAKILRDAARQDIGLNADEVWTELRLCDWEARRQIDRTQPANKFPHA